VSKALKLTGGEDATETSTFVDMMDKFFDSLNVHNYTHGLHSRKSFQMSYTLASDTRLKVCIYGIIYEQVLNIRCQRQVHA